jgi:hypothetical protein
VTTDSQIAATVGALKDRDVIFTKPANCFPYDLTIAENTWPSKFWHDVAPLFCGLLL